jgi:hypothetical protein
MKLPYQQLARDHGRPLPYLPDAQLDPLLKRIKKRKATYDEIDLLVRDHAYWRQKASEWKFLLDRCQETDSVWLDDRKVPDLDHLAKEKSDG